MKYKVDVNIMEYVLRYDNAYIPNLFYTADF